MLSCLMQKIEERSVKQVIRFPESCHSFNRHMEDSETISSRLASLGSLNFVEK
jgi:hypothetical protein